MTGADVKNGAIGVAILAGLFIAYKLYTRLAQPGALNPASDKNVVYQGASSVVQSATGGKYLSVGDWLFGKLNPSLDTVNLTTDLSQFHKSQ